MSDGSIVDVEIENISNTLAEIAQSLHLLTIQPPYTYLAQTVGGHLMRVGRLNGEVAILVPGDAGAWYWQGLNIEE